MLKKQMMLSVSDLSNFQFSIHQPNFTSSDMVSFLIELMSSLNLSHTLSTILELKTLKLLKEPGLQQSDDLWDDCLSQQNIILKTPHMEGNFLKYILKLMKKTSAMRKYILVVYRCQKNKILKPPTIKGL